MQITFVTSFAKGGIAVLGINPRRQGSFQKKRWNSTSVYKRTEGLKIKNWKKRILSQERNEERKRANETGKGERLSGEKQPKPSLCLE